MRTAECIDTKRCRSPGDRYPRISFSRDRNGRWLFSARLLSPLWARCSRPGATSRFAAAYERSLSVTMRFGAWRVFFMRRRSNRLATLASRRGCRISSSTTPCSSTAPQPEPLAADRDLDLVEVPDPARASLPSPQPPRDRGAELRHPAAQALVRDLDATLEQHLLDRAQAEREAQIEPDGMGDDCGGEAVALVERGGLGHLALLLASSRSDEGGQELM